MPPTLPVLADVDEVFDELPPQAVTTRHTVANDIAHLKRFIDTLRRAETKWREAKRAFDEHPGSRVLSVG